MENHMTIGFELTEALRASMARLSPRTLSMVTNNLDDTARAMKATEPLDYAAWKHVRDHANWLFFLGDHQGYDEIPYSELIHLRIYELTQRAVFYHNNNVMKSAARLLESIRSLLRLFS